MITDIPDALAHGAEVRADAMVTGVEVEERSTECGSVGREAARDDIALLTFRRQDASDNA